MQSLGLIYNPIYRVLICREHEHAITPKQIRRHLWELHAAKGPIVEQIRKEVEQLPLCAPEELPVPTIPCSPVEGLRIQTFFRCTLPNCPEDPTACTRRKATVLKHQTKYHAVGPRKRQAWIPSMVEEVRMQSFFAHPLEKYFPIVPEHQDAPGGPLAQPNPEGCLPGSHPTTEQEEEYQTILTQQYQHSQQKWSGNLEDFRENLELHASQTPPWLTTTGIAPFLEGLQATKDEIRSLLDSQDLTDDVRGRIEECIQYRLHRLRRKTRPGLELETIDRTTARLLNSFRPDCIQTKPFFGVQNEETLDRYAKQWSTLLTFLVRLQRRGTDSPFHEYCMQSGSPLESMVQRVTRSAEKWQAAVGLDRPVAPYLNQTVPSDCRESTRANTKAQKLLTACDRLSTHLVLEQHTGNPFTLGVVIFTASSSLRMNGAWVQAADFRPFLSGMIHCMQLWFLGHCLHRYQRLPTRNPPPQLAPLVKEECQKYLVNTALAPMAELSFWRLTCNKAQNDAVRIPLTTISPDCMQITHASLELSLSHWRTAVVQWTKQAKAILDRELLFNIPNLTSYPLTILHDDPTNWTPGFSFLNDPRNALHAVQDTVRDQHRHNPAIRKQFLWENAPDYTGTLKPNITVIEEYLHAVHRWQQLIGVLIYSTAGLPPRRKELLGISWCNQEVPRNIYLLNQQVVMITGYSKTQWRTGTRPIARFLPNQVGGLLVKYLIYLPQWIRYLYYCMEKPQPGPYLFHDSQGVWQPGQFSRCLKLHTAREIGVCINHRQWRHIAIALDRRLLQGVGCQAYQIPPEWGTGALHAVETSDSEADGPLHRETHLSTLPTGYGVHSFQAAHSEKTHNDRYGNRFNPFDLTDSLLAAYHHVSQQWAEHVVQLPTQETACGHKRLTDAHETLDVEELATKHPAKGSAWPVRRQLWTWKAIEQALQDLFGPHAAVRDDSQREALMLVARGLAETIMVMPTGSGKTIVYLLPTLLPQAQVTVVIVPLVACKQDLLKRCRQWKLAVMQYNPLDTGQEDRLHAVPNIVLVDIDYAVTTTFRAFLIALSRAGRLDRLVLDEAHLVLTAAHYRENLGLLAVLRQIQCPLLCLTATLPPFAEVDLKQALGMLHAIVFRVQSDRPNLQYCVQTLSHPKSDEPKRPDEERLLQYALSICQADIQRWRKDDHEFQTTARGLIYVRYRDFGHRLAKALGSLFYHGQLDRDERDEIATAWSRGTGTSPYLVTTSAFGAGVDELRVRRVLHLDAPVGLVEYAQETGRAGRDGRQAMCLTVLPPHWTISRDDRYCGYFMEQNQRTMATFLQLQAPRCYRSYLSEYLDGQLPHFRTCKDNPLVMKHQAACGNCRQTRPLADCMQNESLEVDVLDATAHISEDCSKQIHQTRSDRSTELLMAGSTDRGTDDQRTHETIDIAAWVQRQDCMQASEAQAVYEQRLARWGRACIPCSFVHQRTITGSHSDCMQSKYRDTLDYLRRNIPFQAGIGCWFCGQSRTFCRNFRKDQPCPQPWLIFHGCWTALYLDQVHAVQMIQILGGPNPGKSFEDQYKRYLTWFGLKTQVFNHCRASNAMRFVQVWLDRLETLCSEQLATM